jgi:hypothetical protein
MLFPNSLGAFRPNGKTVALSVTNIAHGSVAITASDETPVGFAEFQNTGATTVAISFAPKGGTAPTAVLPADGSPTATIILPPNMQQPKVYQTPGATFAVDAIGSAAGPSLVYITPLAV